MLDSNLSVNRTYLLSLCSSYNGHIIDYPKSERFKTIILLYSQILKDRNSEKKQWEWLSSAHNIWERNWKDWEAGAHSWWKTGIIYPHVGCLCSDNVKTRNTKGTCMPACGLSLWPGFLTP